MRDTEFLKGTDNFLNKVDKTIEEIAHEGTGDISNIIKMARGGNTNYKMKAIDDPVESERQPEITVEPYNLQESGRLYIDDFVGSRANDGTAFAIGSRNCGERLVLNYKGISALLLTKYGNFDLGVFDISDNVTELEFNGILFKRVDKGDQ